MRYLEALMRESSDSADTDEEKEVLNEPLSIRIIGFTPKLDHKS
jgi:hypothetical protein